MKIYEGSRWIDWETKDAACWLDLVFDTLPPLGSVIPYDEDAPIMAWWRRWAAEGGSRHA